MISIIVAMDRNRVIGKNNELPWHIPADLNYFKRMTSGHTVVMGRKTFESIGKPLPNRKNVIVTRNRAFKADGCSVIHHIDALLELAHENDIFVIGGAQVYRAVWEHVDRLFITFIDHEFEGDAYFPEVDENDWRLVSKEKGIKDKKNPYDYYFTVYERQAVD